MTHIGKNRVALWIGACLIWATASPGAAQDEPAEAEAAAQVQAPTEETPDDTPAADPERKDRLGDPLPAGSTSRIGTLRFRSDARARALVGSSDGRWMATITEDDTIELWDATRGLLARSLAVPDDAPAQALAFSPDGQELAAATLAGISRWALPNAEPLPPLTASDLPLRALAFGENKQGRWIAAGGDDKLVHLWSRDTNALERSLESHQGPISAVLFDPKGDTLISASLDGTWIAWALKSGRQGRAVTAHGGAPIFTAALHPNGKTLATSGNDDAVRLWEVTRGRELRALPSKEGAPTSLAFSPSGDELAGTSALSPVRIWDSRSGRPLKNLKTTRARAVTFSGDGQSLFAAGWGLDQWDVNSGTDLLGSLGHRGAIRALAFGQQGRALLTGGADQGVFLWEAATGYQLQTLSSRKPLQDIDFSKDGALAALAAQDPTIRLFDFNNGAERALTAHERPVTTVSFSPDGARLASGGEDATLILWGLQDGRPLRRFFGGRGRVRALAWSPTAPLLASALERGWFDDDQESLAVWHTENGSLMFRLPAAELVHAVAFSPNGERLAAAYGSGLVRVFDVRSARELSSLQGHSGDVFAATWSPDGATLATGGEDGVIRLWDAQSGAARRALEGHQGPIYDLAFAPDGATLASASADTTVLVWDVAAP